MKGLQAVLSRDRPAGDFSMPEYPTGRGSCAGLWSGGQGSHRDCAVDLRVVTHFDRWRPRIRRLYPA